MISQSFSQSRLTICQKDLLGHTCPSGSQRPKTASEALPGEAQPPRQNSSGSACLSHACLRRWHAPYSASTSVRTTRFQLHRICEVGLDTTSDPHDLLEILERPDSDRPQLWQRTVLSSNIQISEFAGHRVDDSFGDVRGAVAHPLEFVSHLDQVRACANRAPLLEHACKKQIEGLLV